MAFAEWKQPFNAKMAILNAAQKQEAALL